MDSPSINILKIGDFPVAINEVLRYKNFSISHKKVLSDAIKFIKTKKPDVVLLNVQGAFKKGIHQIKTLLSTDPEILLIVITQLTNIEKHLAFINEGAEDCFTSQQISSLPKTIEYALARRKNTTHLSYMEAHDKYNLINEYSQDVNWIMDENLKFLYLSPSIKNMRGFTVEEVMNQSFEQLFIPESFKKVSAIIKKFFISLNNREIIKEPFRIEVWQPHKDGRTVPVEVIVNPIFDDNDNFKYFLGMSRDISQRIKSEKDLLESKEHYKLIVENQNDLIIKLNPEFNIVFASPQYCKTFNKTEEELIGKSFMPLIHPDDREIVIEAMGKLLKKPYTSIHTERVLTNDGWTWFEWSNKAIVDKKGIIKEIISVGRNIHKEKISEESLKKSEENYRTLFNLNTAILESVHDIIMKVNNDKIYTWANKAGFEYFGDDVIGKSADYYFEGEQETYQMVQPLFNGFEDIIYVESWQKRKDGEIRLLAWWCKTLKDSSGNVIGALSTAQDITEKKKIEEAIKESEEKYRGLFNSIRDAIIIADTDRIIIDCNPAFESLFGYSLDEIKGKQTSEIYETHEQYENFGKAIIEFSDSQQPFIKVNNYKKKNGKIFKGETAFFYLKDSNNDVSGYIGLMRDITEQLFIEDELQQQQEKLNNIITHSNELFYMHDTDYNILYVSPQSEKMFGYNTQEMLVKWTTLVTNNPINQIGFEKTMEAIETGQRQKPYLLEVTRKDGTNIIVEVDESPLKDDEGKVIAVSGALRDVTEKYYREKELKNLASFVELNPYPTISFDSNEIITYANPAARYIFGVSIAKNVLLSEIFPDQDISEFLLTIVKGSTYTFQIKSDIRTYLFIVKGIPDTKIGHIYGADISSLSKIQEDLGKSQKQLQAYAGYLQSIREEERLSIAREIHDDFSQMLSALKMFISSIMKNIDDKSDNNIEKVKNEVVNINLMLDKAINSVRNVLKKLRPEVLEDFGLLEALKILVDEFAISSGIKCDFQSEVESIVLEQSEQLAVYRICQEALTNISRHSGAISSSLKIQITETNYIISIKDDGQGFDDEITYNKDSFGIIGMRERASASGGKLIINSKTGEGTLIQVHVPIGN